MEATKLQDSAAEAPKADVAVLPVKKKTPNRAFLVLGIIAVVVVATVAIHSALTAGQQGTDNVQIEADVVPISARVAGPVLHVKVEDNQAVKKGDVIVELDDADYSARVKQAQAELEVAQASAAAADAQASVVDATARGGFSSARAQVSGSAVAVGSADAQIAAAKAGVARAETDLRKADNDLQRAKSLRTANAIPQERLDNAQASYDSAQAALAQAQAQLDAAGEGKRVAVSRVAEARGRLDQSAPIQSQISVARANANLAHAKAASAQAALDFAKLQLGYTKVLAPSDGFVSKLSAREGQLLQPGQLFAELVPSTTYLVANFKETQLGQMHPGDRAEIEVDAFPHRKFEGKVVSISGGTGARFSLLPPDNASGNFVKVVQRVPVRIAWAQQPGVPMQAGLSADVTVFTQQ